MYIFNMFSAGLALTLYSILKAEILQPESVVQEVIALIWHHSKDRQPLYFNWKKNS